MNRPAEPVGHGADAEALLHFLYQLPVAVVRIDRRGDIDLMNPCAAALLQALGLPCVGAGAGEALLQALDADTARRAQAMAGEVGTVVSRLPLARPDRQGQPRQLALTLQIAGPGVRMLSLEDVTALHAAQAARLASERRFRELVEVIPAGVVLHGPDADIRLANAEAARLLGLGREQLVGLAARDPRWHFLAADGTPQAPSAYPVNQVLATGQPIRQLVAGIRLPGAAEPTWVMVNATPVRSADGTLDEVCVSFTDVTRLKEAERALSQSEERYRLVLKGSNDAPWDWDLVRGTVYYAPRWWEMLGRPADPQATDPAVWLDSLHPDDRTRVVQQLQAAVDQGREAFEVECRFLRPDGEAVDVLTRGYILRDASGQAVRISGTHLDLRERKRAAAEIQRLAFNDPLTGLPNRRRLMERVGEALAASARSLCHGALFFIDLDRFKELNDTRGHDQGDLLLQEVAARLRACTRKTDTVARLGGDEFVVLLEHLSADGREAAVDAERLAQKILQALHRSFEIRGSPYHSGASIGLTLFGPGGQAVEDLLKQADLAMYRAKSLGGRRMQFFDESMQAAVDERVALEAELRQALQHGELLLHLQPQVRRGIGITGAEALVRWQHPRRGLVFPGAFIPLAEETGQILPLGRWVLRAACTQLARWAAQPALAGLTLAVNVSVHQLSDPGFVDEVLAVVAETGADPRRLKLELTESALAQDVALVVHKMRQLKQQGVLLALDDFGTGYSSLSYLKQLPLDELKIDGAFVRDVITDPNDATLVRTIVTLAQAFGLGVIGEGVETAAQRDFLAQVGCEDFQGYLFGRPEPVAVFEQRVRDGVDAGLSPG